MNGRDVAAVLGILAAAWPNHALSEQTAAVWRDAVTDLEAPDAMAAARRLIRTSHWFPSIAQFREEAMSQATARRAHEPPPHGLPAGLKVRPDPERLAGVMETLRVQLDVRRGAGDHRHQGPSPCPVCGGMADGAGSSADVPAQARRWNK